MNIIKKQILKIYFFKKIIIFLKLLIYRNNYSFNLLRGNEKMLERDYKEAIKCYSHLIKLNTENLVHFYKRAEAYMFIGNYARAISDFTKIIDSKKNYWYVYLHRGMARELNGDLKGACNDYLKNLSIYKNCPLTYKLIALAKEKLGDIQAAIDACTKSINLCEIYYGVYRERGRMKMSLGLYEEAIADFNKEISNEPNDFIALTLRSECYENISNFNNAYFDMKYAFKIANKEFTSSFLKDNIKLYTQGK